MEITKNDILTLTKEELEKQENNENKKILIEIKQEFTTDEKLAMSVLSNIEKPFSMLSLKQVADDLKISNSLAYKLFRREDFPSINVGKKNQIMLLPYILWKMKRQV